MNGKNRSCTAGAQGVTTGCAGNWPHRGSDRRLEGRKTPSRRGTEPRKPAHRCSGTAVNGRQSTVGSAACPRFDNGSVRVDRRRHRFYRPNTDPRGRMIVVLSGSPWIPTVPAVVNRGERHRCRSRGVTTRPCGIAVSAAPNRCFGRLNPVNRMADDCARAMIAKRRLHTAEPSAPSPIFGRQNRVNRSWHRPQWMAMANARHNAADKGVRHG